MNPSADTLNHPAMRRTGCGHAPGASPIGKVGGILGIFLLAMLMLQPGGRLAAHELQPALLQLRQTGPETFDVLWKIPPRDDLRDARPRWPSESRVISDPVLSSTDDAFAERYRLHCPGGLDNKTLALEGALAGLFDVIVRLERENGTTQVMRLTPAEPTALVSPVPERWRQSLMFLRLGVDHILMGVDHLLFVLGLMMIVRSRWMLVKTITSFTVAHSITLAVATLGWASAPIPPLNAAIALSILFLGPEMARARRGETSLAIDHPWVVAFAFGLLHGFGFASGLTELGLERAEIPMALLFFNIGVELGQLFFVGLVFLLARSFRTLEIRWKPWALWLPTYVVGSLGAYWTLQRTVILITALR